MSLTAVEQEMPSVVSIDLSHFWESAEDRNIVWNSLEPWFKVHGYVLYPRDPSGVTQPTADSVYELRSNPVKFPYAYAPDKTADGRAFCPWVSNVYNACSVHFHA